MRVHSMQVTIGIDPAECFRDADWALMVGAKPRGPGMERADLLNQNGEIFQKQVSGGAAAARFDAAAALPSRCWECSIA